MQQKIDSSVERQSVASTADTRQLRTQDRERIDLSSTIRGWGSDLDRGARPGVPRDRAPELGAELLYPLIEPQTPSSRIHRSTEHGRLPPVFGTSCPPVGLSGKLRDAAYRLSEGRLGHWLMLMLADRVNVVEGVLGDLARGRVPNISKETGLRSELTYNREAFQRKVAVTTACVVGVLVVRMIVKARR